MANVLDMDDELPGFLHLPHLDSWRVLGFLGLILIVFLLALGAEVLITGPDLRADGLHGILAPRVLGFQASPVMLYDLDENTNPWGRCTWAAMRTCTCCMIPVPRPSGSCRSVPRAWS